MQHEAGADRTTRRATTGSSEARLAALEAEVAALRTAVGAAGTLLAAQGPGSDATVGPGAGPTPGAKPLPLTNATRKGIRTGLQVAAAAVPSFAIAHFGSLGASAAPYLTLGLTPLVALTQNAIEDNVLGHAFLRNVTPKAKAEPQIEDEPPPHP